MTRTAVVARIELLRPKLDDATYAALMRTAPRIVRIVREANRRGVGFFICGLGLGYAPLPLEMILQDSGCGAYRPTICLHRAYGRSKAQEIGLQEAFLFLGAVENIFIRVAGWEFRTPPVMRKAA